MMIRWRMPVTPSTFFAFPTSATDVGVENTSSGQNDLGQARCEICKSTYKNDGWGKRSMTFGFCCSRCVSRACRVVRRHNRRARRVNSNGTLYGYHWLTVLYSYNFACAMCGTNHTKELTLDHIKKLSDGGNNLPHNIQPLCFECHGKKDNIASK